MKRIIYLVFLLLPMVAKAYDFMVDGIAYNINGDNAIVTYTAEGSNHNYNGSLMGELSIPSNVTYDGTTYTVTAIDQYAFYYCTGLTDVSIPNTVTYIGNNAFYLCNGLSSLFIPRSVSFIGDYAFNDCSGLESITVDNNNSKYDSRDNCNAIINTTSNVLVAGCKNSYIPYSVVSIGNGAFGGCTGLTDIEIPNSVTSIGSWAFCQCSGLTQVDIPNSVTSISMYAFAYCYGLRSLNIPNSVTTISSHAFFWCSGLTSVVIPNSVTYIGNGAFCACENLTRIDLPNSVIIEAIAFYDCKSLTSINIGPGVLHINENAFVDCASVTHVYCFATTPPEADDNTFSDYSAILHVPAASLANYFTAACWRNFENIVGDAVAPIGLSINNDSVDIQLGEQIRLIATVTPENASIKEITWISTDTTVATVNNGLVVAVGFGECNIIASCFGMQVMCHVLVANRITLDQQEAMLLPNHILTLTPTPTIPGIYTVSSSDPTVAAARVLSSGKVQVVGIKEGTTTITVGSVDGTAIPATCLITVYTEPGDLDSDGFVTISDVTSLIDFLLGGDDTSVTIKNADVDGDGRINIADVTSLIDALLSKTE